jgi:hypothetical protein
MRLIVVLIGCFGCGVYSDGQRAEMVSVVKPGPIHDPKELFAPTPPQLQCGAACNVDIVDASASPEEREHARADQRARSARR